VFGGRSPISHVMFVDVDVNVNVNVNVDVDE
jgi:hypothetical protein